MCMEGVPGQCIHIKRRTLAPALVALPCGAEGKSWRGGEAGCEIEENPRCCRDTFQKNPLRRARILKDVDKWEW